MGIRIVRLGSRISPLARVQTEQVAAALREVDPDLRIEVVPIVTGGDRSQHTNQPDEAWGSGVFVKEIEAALLRGEIDFAVHSLKDVPPELPRDTTLAAIPPREDPHDALVTLDGRGPDELPPGARVGTSSARRSAFLRAVRPDLAFVPIRGNVETRLRKLADGEYDALVLAVAGLRRLELSPRVHTLDPQLLPPAPGQGALAVEARAGDRVLLDLIEPLHDPATGAAVRAERRLMLLLEGGCRLPIGALATPRADGRLSLLGGVAQFDGRRTVIETDEGYMSAPEELAEALADRLQRAGAGELVRGVPA